MRRRRRARRQAWCGWVMAGERWAGWIPSPLPAGHGRARTRGGFRRRPERMQGGDGEVSRVFVFVFYFFSVFFF